MKNCEQSPFSHLDIERRGPRALDMARVTWLLIGVLIGFQFVYSCHYLCHFPQSGLSFYWLFKNKEIQLVPALFPVLLQVMKYLKVGSNRLSRQPKHFSSFFCLSRSAVESLRDYRRRKTRGPPVASSNT